MNDHTKGTAGEAVHPVLWVDPMELAAVQIHGGMIVATAHEEASSKRTQPLYPSTPAASAPLVEALRKARAAVDGFRFDSDVDVFRLIDAIAGIADAALAAYDASHEGRA